jgi:hypothetical protein
MASQEDLDAYIEKLSGNIESTMRQILWSYAQREDVLEELRTRGTTQELESRLKTSYPDIAELSCSLKTLRFPDLILYKDVRALYNDYLASQRQAMQDDVMQIARETLALTLRLEELCRYGDLITKYPLLLQYLAMERGQPIWPFTPDAPPGP